MVGIVIAFQDFNPMKGIFQSEFVGWRNFSVLFDSPALGRVVFNTLYLNALFLIFDMVFSIAIALFLNEINSKYYKKLTQSIILLPHFISWTVVAMFANILLGSDTGYINIILKKLNMQPISFYSTPEVWPPLLTILYVWKNAGFDSIVYLATITSIDNEIYEAATIDGTSKIQKIWYITLPLIKNTAILLFLLGVGKIFYGNFGLIYPLVGSNSLLYPTTDIIDTYIYRALMELGDMGMSAAVGLSQSVLGFIIVIITNGIARKFNPESAIF
ncbi:MAG TPA: ABC transporter permease subunit [Tissierellaceae bacterium]